MTTPEQLAKWRGEAVKKSMQWYAEIDGHMPLNVTSIYQAGYLRAKQETEQSLPMVSGEPVATPKLTSQEQTAFNRFLETCEDGEGYDVPKSMMQRLAQIGVVRHVSRGIYTITKFGQSVAEPHLTSPQPLTPITADDVTDEMIAAIKKSTPMQGAVTSERIAATYNAVIKHRG